MKENALEMKPEKTGQTACFERTYIKNGLEYMDVFIALN